MSRRFAIVGLAATIALGILSRRVRVGFLLWDKSLGDALYAVMIYFLLALARRQLGPRALGSTALLVSFAIELFQLTGIPRDLPRLLRFALGVEFAWHDVVCYVVGAAVITSLDAWMRRQR